MAVIGYYIRVELKKQLGAPAEESRACFVLPPTDCKLSYSEAAEMAFVIIAEALHDISRYPVMEEAAQRRVSIADLRPFRNSILLEKDGWKCFRISG